MEKAKVTILLAAYKGNEFAGTQIDSILAQDCGDWQLILSDDGEETADLLESYAAAYPEKIRHIRSGQRFGSAQKHFLYLLAHCGLETPYVMFSDQDDVWHADKVRKTLAVMEAAESDPDEPVLVHTDLKVVDGNLTEIAPSFLAFSKIDGTRLAFNELLVQNVVTGCTMMINHALAVLAVRAENVPQMMMHDWWLALLASAFGKIAFLPEATMDYRQHGKNQVGAKNAGSLGYLLSRLNGSYVTAMRDGTAVQAAAFLKLYGDKMSPEQQKTCRAMAGLVSHGKAWRLRSMSRYHLWKNTLPRKMGQVIYW